MIVDRSNRRTILVGSIDGTIAVLVLPVDDLALGLQLGLVKLAFNFVVFNIFHGMRLPVRKFSSTTHIKTRRALARQ